MFSAFNFIEHFSFILCHPLMILQNSTIIIAFLSSNKKLSFRKSQLAQFHKAWVSDLRLDLAFDSQVQLFSCTQPVTGNFICYY